MGTPLSMVPKITSTSSFCKSEGNSLRKSRVRTLMTFSQVSAMFVLDSVLQRVAACCSALQSARHRSHTSAPCSFYIVCCSVLQCDTVYCNVLACVVVCCSVLQVRGQSIEKVARAHFGDILQSQCYRGVTKCFAECCSVLQVRGQPVEKVSYAHFGDILQSQRYHGVT